MSHPGLLPCYAVEIDYLPYCGGGIVGAGVGMEWVADGGTGLVEVSELFEKAQQVLELVEIVLVATSAGVNGWLVAEQACIVMGS